jgi:glycolate oxidase iron-sulfur subunit
MQTQLAPEFQGTPEGVEAEAILRKCVHCGFCLATCPTYQLLGDELDSPRGRIYLMKQVLEGATPTRATQLHLDRCLTCRNCETTCPSGVEYGKLVDIGRKIVEDKVPRPAVERGLLPESLRAKVPARENPGLWPTREHARKVLLLAGCVQPAMMPGINSATARVLDAIGIQTVVAPDAGCCGAVKFHLNDQDGGKAEMRANIDAWWPQVESGAVEAIVMNASGCGVTVKEYGHHLQHDAAYAEKAARISALTRDLSELLPEIAPALQGKLRRVPQGVVAFHPPCTLQHGQQLRGGVEQHLRALGFDIRLTLCESHLCCGSAGTYSVLQADLSHQLLERKIGHLAALEPVVITSANIGCITHLQSGTATPVKHWVQVLDEALA